jgi:ATP-dependent Clp protease ATP-binding subunit ClpA
MFCDANYLCEAYRHEFFTPVHCLLALFRQEAFTSAVYQCASEPETLQAELRDDMSEIEPVPSGMDFAITPLSNHAQGIAVGCQSSGSVKRQFSYHSTYCEEHY